MIKKIKYLLIEYISIGADEKTSLAELKKIKLLNLYISLWYIFFIIVFFRAVQNNNYILINTTVGLASIVLIQVFQHFKKYTTARLYYVFLIIVTIFINTNFIEAYKDKFYFLEFLYILPPCLSLIFFDNKKINLSVLFVSLLTMFISYFFFKNNYIDVFNYFIIVVFYFSIYIIISYFKNLNIRNEKKLEAKTKELQELDQFKSQFFTNISHEIRTPLTLINGQITDLEILVDTPETKNIQQNIKKQIHNITNMVDSVLDLSKMQSSSFNLQLKEVNLLEFFRKIHMNFEPLFNQKNIEFYVPENTKDYIANIDIVFFEKAINNLIINALKYTDEGGVTLDLYQQNNDVIIKIIDTGIGIGGNDLENVFKRFYQVNNDVNKAGGSGIGLAFSKEIVELHKGKISLQSEPNIGSEFTITLPLINDVICDDIKELKNDFNDGKVIKNVEELEILSSSNQTFLIVDDNFDMRKYLVSILEDYHCLEASNGLEALDVIATNKIDFIITDYMMPKLNGYELIVKLNTNNNNIPVIMLTAKTDVDTKLNVLKLGVDDYLTKPFNKEELLVRIYNCLENNLEKNSYNKGHQVVKEVSYADSFIDKLKMYIYINSNDMSLNQEMLSIEFNISKSSFYRKIKSRTGLSPNKFILEIRLQKAREILESNPETSLKKLALDSGFKHTSYFSTVYQKRFGVKPSLKI